MPTGKLLGQEAVTRKTRPQLSKLNSTGLRPMFATRVARSRVVLDSSDFISKREIRIRYRFRDTSVAANVPFAVAVADRGRLGPSKTQFCRSHLMTKSRSSPLLSVRSPNRRRTTDQRHARRPVPSPNQCDFFSAIYQWFLNLN